MTKKLVACALLLTAGGCRMCSDCCDYAPVVPGGPPLGTSRSGSILTGAAYGTSYSNLPMGQPVPMPAVVEETAAPITDDPAALGS
jgi:hypothetical protein